MDITPILVALIGVISMVIENLLAGWKKRQEQQKSESAETEPSQEKIEGHSDISADQMVSDPTTPRISVANNSHKALGELNQVPIQLQSPLSNLPQISITINIYMPINKSNQLKLHKRKHLKKKAVF